LHAITGWITSDLSLWGLFVSSLLAATLLPGGSEAVLVGVLKLHPELFWPALIIGTLGNTIGGMTTFGMGWLLPQRMGGSKAAGPRQDHPQVQQEQRLKHVEKVRLRHGGAEPSDARGAASHLLAQWSDFDRNVLRVRRFGSPVLLLAWAPIIGDALCLAAGWLRQNPLYAALFMGVGKFARYWVIAMALP
jgi:membrane protein YqaA with SNARE-associated domain